MTAPEREACQRWIVGAVAASVLLRARFLAAPLSVDEAGALVVARSWGHGQRLYVDAFIDRPQGVVALFQRWDTIAGGHPSSVRLVAIVAGIAVVLGAAGAARAISGSWRAAAAAAWLVAILSSTAAFEGYVANGELLAGGLTVPAMAVGALVIVRRWPAPWMLLAGALAAGGITMKQSGFDVLLALGAWLVLAGACRWIPRREAARLLALLAVGAGAVLGLLVWHGTTLGWDHYRYAMWGFRSHARSAIAGPQLGRMAITLLVALPILGPTVIVVLRHLSHPPAPWRRARPAHWLVALWLAAATAAFVVGGNYHRHYWVGLTFPFATLAGIGLAAAPSTLASVRRSLAISLAVPLAISIVLIVAPGIERDPRVDADRALATWVRTHRDQPDDDLLPLCASVTYYADTGRLPPTPYLWVDHVRHGRGSPADLIVLLEGPDRPTYLALHQDLSDCDPSGRLQAVVEQRYERVATVDGVEVLQART